MSYRDPKQALEPSLSKLIDGIAEFTTATTNRLLTDGEWRQDHLDEIHKLMVELIKIRPNLIKVKKETW